MTTTALAPTTTPTSQNRNGLLAVFGAVDAAVLTAIGTFWDVTGNDSGGASRSWGDYAICLGVIAVATGVVFGLVVRTAAAGNPGRRGVILGVLSVLTGAVAWSGLPMVLAAGALACAFLRRERHGAFGTAGAAILVEVALATAGAIAFAIAA
jgi:hypothetical protein